MKKNTIVTTVMAVMMGAALMMTACGGSAGTGKTDAAADAADAGTATEADADSGEGSDYIGDPWTNDVTPDDVYELVNAYFIVPEGAEDVLYRLLKSDDLAEMQFKLDGMDFNARMKPTDGFEDISGIYCEWDVDDEQMVGPSEGRARGYAGDGEMTHSLLWRDDVTGLMYSLSVTAEDLDGFDIVGVAESMYQPEF